jgi:hypothetical protein
MVAHIDDMRSAQWRWPQLSNGELIMRPIRSILDASFCYVPSVATSVASTWRRAGWRPTTDEERKARRKPSAELVVDWIGAADAPAKVARQRRKTQSAAEMCKTPEPPLRIVMR